MATAHDGQGISFTFSSLLWWQWVETEWQCWRKWNWCQCQWWMIKILLLNVAQAFVVHVSAYAIFYDVRILQLLHILALGLHFFLCFAVFCNCFFSFVTMATYQINKFKSHFERAFNYLSHDITHVYDTWSKKKVTRFLNLGNRMFFKLSQEAGVRANYSTVN